MLFFNVRMIGIGLLIGVRTTAAQSRGNWSLLHTRSGYGLIRTAMVEGWTGLTTKGTEDQPRAVRRVD
jgi:hypothetical protein